MKTRIDVIPIKHARSRKRARAWRGWLPPQAALILCLAPVCLLAQISPPAGFYSVAYGSGQFVAVGSGGRIATSSDAADWVSRNSGTANQFNRVTYGNGQFVAVGYDGTIVTSSDGANWTSRDSGTDTYLHGVSYGNGEFVVVGDDWTILTSTDGANWTWSYSGTGNDLNAIAYGNGQFVAVAGRPGVNAGAILTSPDSANWTGVGSGTGPDLNTIAYGGGQFVAVGSAGTILTSSDGVNWTSRNSGTRNSLGGVAYGNGQFAATGWAGTILASTDGAKWATRKSGTRNSLFGVAYGNGQFVAVGSAWAVVTSTDASAWSSPQPGTAPLSVAVSPPGGGTVIPNYNGHVLQIGKSCSMTARPAKGFSFVNWTGSAASSSPRLIFIMASNLTFNANFKDTQRPVLTVLSPKARQILTSLSVTLTGKASDNVGVEAVYYQLNGGAWALADGTTAWSAPNVDLTPGANLLRAYAVDAAGNASLTNTVSFTYLVSAPLSATVSPLGGGTVAPNYNDRLLQIGKTYSMTAKSARGFSFVNWTGSAATSSPKLTFLMASNLTFTANFKDTQRPVLTVLYPKNKQTVTSGAVTVTGKAGDNVGVDAVYYQLNGGDWALAQGTTAWYAPNLDLTPGANVIRAYAVDGAGNASLTNTVSFTYLVSAPLAVIVSPSGGGTVTPHYSGHLLQIGKTYSMTARPAKGFSFVNWSGSASGNSPRLTFAMASNLTFTANFKGTQPPAQTYTYATLYSFGSVPHDGEHPAVSLTAVGSMLYGVTSAGGAYGQGTIFAMKANGSGYTNLYNFGTNAGDGGPSGNLTFVGGKLYGATRNGGNNGMGTVFSIDTDGTGYTQLYGAFSDGFPNAYSPNSLVSDGSTLYGTSQGGNFYASCPQYPGQVGNPFGTVFSIHPDGSAYNTLYNFGSLFGCTDAAYPVDGMILAGSTLYGMSPDGGDGANWYGSGGIIGSGTIFSIHTDGSGYTILHSFGIGSDGVWPYGGLALVGSTLYGSTWTGGSESNGTVFAVDTDGGNYHVLHNYSYANADFAPSGLTAVGSKLYGTVAAYSVPLYNGTIFSINLDGSDYTILHKFGAVSKDGEHPEAALTLAGSTLYGTAYDGGKNGKGTVFRLSLPNGQNASAGPSIAREALTPPIPKLSIRVSGRDLIVTWPVDGVSYELQSTKNLSERGWTSILAEPTSVNGINTITDPLSSGLRFYRLKPAQ
jgi:uncharacterized repeat protein (TIGR02543 family)